MRQARVDFWVGVLMLLAVLALVFLALKVSGLAFNQQMFGGGSYEVSAAFSDIGDLKIRAPVRVAGVQIGRVIGIKLNKNYQADVVLSINNQINDLPDDTSASIVRSSLLGDNYVSLAPGYDEKMLTNGSQIVTTYSATSLESLISTFMSSSNSNSNSNSASTTTTSSEDQLSKGVNNKH